MNIAEKILEFAENQQEINEMLNGDFSKQYENGVSVGYKEGYSKGTADGKTAEQNAFWDTYQDNGNRRNYDYAFTGSGWTDELFDPKYPIVATSYQQMFAYNDKITSTKDVIIDITAENKSTRNATTFIGCTALVEIPHLVVGKDSDIMNMFDYCYSLEHIGFIGELWDDLYIYSENINDETLMNLVNIAKDFVNDEDESVQELAYNFGIYLKSELVNKLFELETDERFPEQYQGMTLFDVLDTKGWGC